MSQPENLKRKRRDSDDSDSADERRRARMRTCTYERADDETESQIPSVDKEIGDEAQPRDADAYPVEEEPAEDRPRVKYLDIVGPDDDRARWILEEFVKHMERSGVKHAQKRAEAFVRDRFHVTKPPLLVHEDIEDYYDPPYVLKKLGHTVTVPGDDGPIACDCAAAYCPLLKGWWPDEDPAVLTSLQLAGWEFQVPAGCGPDEWIPPLRTHKYDPMGPSFECVSPKYDPDAS